MFRVLCLVYGGLVYAAFFVAFLYLFAFMGNLIVPKSIDSGPAGPLTEAIFVDSLLIGVFVIQHTIMARSWFKSWWTKFVPKPIERSTFVLATNLVLVLLFWQWRPIPAIVWHIENTAFQVGVWSLFALGLFVVLYSSFLIDHFDLFGLRQVFLYFRQREYSHHPFMVRSLYKHVRHPLMVGFLISIWAAPTMTAGHFLFSLLFTAYIFFGTRMEERELIRTLGSEYEQYRAQTPSFVPLPKRREAEGNVPTT